jgi:hypothetical protein
MRSVLVIDNLLMMRRYVSETCKNSVNTIAKTLELTAPVALGRRRLDRLGTYQPPTVRHTLLHLIDPKSEMVRGIDED